MRAPKKARSSGVRSVIGPKARRMSRNTVPASAGVRGNAAGMTNVGLPYCVMPTRVVVQVIRHLAPIERRNAAHGVDDVLVEAGEKPEAVLAGQVVLDRSNSGVRNLIPPLAAGASSLDHWNAARLAARDVAPFEHHDLEAALDEFLRGAHARHAAAQNDDFRPGHGSPANWRMIARFHRRGPTFSISVRGLLAGASGRDDQHSSRAAFLDPECYFFNTRGTQISGPSVTCKKADRIRPWRRPVRWALPPSAMTTTTLYFGKRGRTKLAVPPP